MKSQIAKHLMVAVFAIPLASGAEQVELLTNLGCKVILDDPQIPVLAIRSAVWSGDCRNGYIGGAGELVLFLNTPLRETFTGTAFRGSPLKGSYKRQDGTKYEGEFDPSSRRFFKGTRFSSDGKPIEVGLFDGLGSMVAGKSTVESNEQFEGSLFFGERAQVPDYQTGAGIYDGKLIRNGITIVWFADGKRYVNEADYRAAYARARKAETDENQKSAADTARKIAQIDAETAQRRQREVEMLRKLRDEDRSAGLAVLGAAAGALGGNPGAGSYAPPVYQTPEAAPPSGIVQKNCAIQQGVAPEFNPDCPTPPPRSPRVVGPDCTARAIEIQTRWRQELQQNPRDGSNAERRAQFALRSLFQGECASDARAYQWIAKANQVLNSSTTLAPNGSSSTSASDITANHYPPLTCAIQSSKPSGNRRILCMQNNCGRTIEVNSRSQAMGWGSWSAPPGACYSWQADVNLQVACEKNDSYEPAQNRCRK